ncbi:putative DNA ligase domain protein [Mycobacterium ulcerans str. Harvey]|uniref:DNA ligase domain protein n=1 Tax=Mycobacterium ulcerans str. Harvey TaxID=1299332 RepID=A0ABN0QKX1_MYCUL|nr:putative DNA ligase domain protein [Mycobacterium ulcerans str. Harvey]
MVEVAFDGVQASSRYPAAGVALRPGGALPRRQGPADADTIDTVRALY